MKEDKPKVIETASATTSPDNSNSGHFAYIVAGVTFAVVLLMGLGCAGCASLFLNVAAQEYSSYGSHGRRIDDFVYDEDVDDLEELLDQYSQEFGGFDEGSQEKDGSRASSVSVKEALDFDLAPYGATIDDEVAANAYANVPTDVRDFVRSLVSCDRDHTDELVRLLYAGSKDEEDTLAKVGEARNLCDTARNAILAIEVPTTAKDEGGAIKDLLGTAKSEAARRWDLMAREIDVLNTSDEVDTRRLWNRDEDVIESTEEAGQLLEEAMDAASQL